MEKPLIISNTTPIINFSEIECLDVLIAMFGSITITPAVAAELVAKSHLFPKAAKVAQQRVLGTASPKNARPMGPHHALQGSPASRWAAACIAALGDWGRD